MNEDINHIQYQPIVNYQYEKMFSNITPNGATMNAAQKLHMVELLDERIDLCSEGLQLFYSEIKRKEGGNSEFDNINCIVTSFFLFTIQTIADCNVATKYYLLANTDYDRRYMRGKLRVILNEGFKKLYGFNTDNKRKSEWSKLGSVMKYFSLEIQRQYDNLTSILEGQATSSTWWKSERCLETHLEAIGLYESRLKPIEESVEMIDTLKLIDALDAVNNFWGNVNGCILNFLLDKYHKGELAKE